MDDPKIYDILKQAFEEVEARCGLKIQSIDVQWLNMFDALSERDMSHQIIGITVKGLA